MAELGDQLILVVERAAPIPGGRSQPTQGWDCPADEPVSRGRCRGAGWVHKRWAWQRWRIGGSCPPLSPPLVAKSRR